ncbi:MAG: zinc ribbon domain-containing protein [Chitinophagales bacterium]
MAKKELSTPEKLKALYDLQSIDSKIDRLQVLKGELPLEVEDLEDDIEASKKRIEKMKTELEDLKQEVTGHQVSVENSNALIERYEKQLESVKNNREFDALTKEVGMQKLEIQLSEKKLRIANEKNEAKKTLLEDMNVKLENTIALLEAKKSELSEITKETDIEEEKLQTKSEKAKKKVDDFLLTAYERIRQNYKNGLAVVSAERDSCGGCHISIPPQLQLDIEAELQIIPCENCGRIFTPNYDERKQLEKETAKA